MICSCIISVIHHNFLGHSFLLQSTIASHMLMAVVHFVVLMNIQFLLKFQMIKVVRTVKSLFAMPKLFGFLIFGIIWHGISLASSSFIEEEHQTWYYLNNAVWILLYLIETRQLLNQKLLEKSSKVKTDTGKHQVSIFQNQFQWALLFSGHLIARRLNQTGDKWLNIPDIGDWLQMEENRIWNSLFMSLSLLFVYLTCMDFGSILTNVLTLTACMLIYYYRTLTGFVYFAGIKASE